nr:hypothetical protein [Butyrivibrio sp.]
MKYLVKKRIFAVAFLAGLFVYSGLNIFQNGESIAKEVADQAASLDFSSSEIEDAMKSDIVGKMGLVETYGYVQKKLGKEEFNNFEFIKDKNGYLQYSSFYTESNPELFDYALRVKRAQDYVSAYGTKVLFVMTPAKYDTENSVFSRGLPVNNPYDEVVELMIYLKRLGVETINLDEYMPVEGMTYDETFFKTDHHWTVPAAFEATKIVAGTLNERFDAGFDTDYWLSDERYTQKLYKGHMLGAMGRDTGVNYSGLEDFTALFPNFEGHFSRTYTDNDNEVTKNEGSFTDAFFVSYVLNDDVDYYKNSQYSLYLDQIRNIENLENYDNPDGPNILMIRDSYFAPVMTFMMPMCNKIDALYAYEKLENLEISGYIKDKYEEGERYDYLIIEMYPYNITDEAFRFFREDN